MLQKVWKWILISVVTLPLLSSCWNAEELDKMTYIHSLGIDYKQGQYIVYMQMINFAYLTKEAASSSQHQSQAVVGIGKGNTILDAIRDVYDKSSRRIYWGHLSSVIFSEGGMKKAVKPLIDLMSRYHETRYTIWVYTTEIPLEKILTTFPPTEISEVYAKLGDPRDINKQSSFVKPIQMFEFVRQLSDQGSTVIIPKLGISKKGWDDGDKISNSLTMKDSGMVTKYNFKGFLSSVDNKGLFYSQRLPRFFEYIPIEGKKMATLALAHPKVKWVTHLNNGQPTFDFNVKVKGVVEELDDHIAIRDLQKKAEKQITSEIKHTYKAALKKNIDIYNLSHHMFRQLPKQWLSLQKNGGIPLKEDSLTIHVDLKLMNSYKAGYKPFLR